MPSLHITSPMVTIRNLKVKLINKEEKLIEKLEHLEEKIEKNQKKYFEKSQYETARAERIFTSELKKRQSYLFKLIRSIKESRELNVMNYFSGN